jgi:predicted ATP-grasp superfamily ATP-dependent carboligase
VWFVTDDHPIAKYSRYAARSLTWAGPGDKGAAQWLVDLAARHRLDRWVLFPGGDAEAQLVAQHHDALGQVFALTTPPWAVARFACDKRLTHLHADSVGVDSPPSWFPAHRKDIAALDCGFPVILKPTSHAGRNRFTMAKAWRVGDRATLLARYDEAVALVGRDAVMVQDLIPGGGDAQFSYAAVWDRGKPVASLVARRTRQYPVDFGFTSTFVETIEHGEVEAQAFRFLADLRFSGMAELEFKHDARDSRTKLLDVNPRAWTWIGLGAAAGVDLPGAKPSPACAAAPAAPGPTPPATWWRRFDPSSATRSARPTTRVPCCARSPSRRSRRMIRGPPSSTCRSRPAAS